MEAWFDALWHGALRTLVLVAHPDDESIGAGGLLPKLPEVTVVFATDGAPQDPRRGLVGAARAAYGQRRRSESDAALDLAGVPAHRRIHLGYVDQRTPWQLDALVADVGRILDHVRPDVVLTHPYEGGHPDHDALAVALAAALGRRPDPPLHVEMAFYHRVGDHLRTGAFLPGGPPVHARWLTTEEQASKHRMLAAYATQAVTVARFGVHVERYRRAPPLALHRPPHPGRLHYEAKGWFDQVTFRGLAEALWEPVC